MAIDKIQSESINLADTFAFTGTVTGAGGANTPAFFAISTSTEDNTDISDNTYTKMTFSTEVFDTNSTYSSNRFTPGVAGKYFITAKGVAQNLVNGGRGALAIYKNGSIMDDPYTSFFEDGNAASAGFCSMSVGAIVESDADDYFEIYAKKNDGGNTGGIYDKYFGAYKIIT